MAAIAMTKDLKLMMAQLTPFSNDAVKHVTGYHWSIKPIHRDTIFS